jgi:hypothetical protein
MASFQRVKYRSWILPRDNNLYIHVIVYRNKFLFNNQTDASIIQIYSVIKLYICFGHLLCPSSGVFYCTFGTGKFHAGFLWPLPSRVRMEPSFMLMSICLVRFVFLFLLGWVCCFCGFYFIINDLVYFSDWNIITLNGRSIIMTFLFDWISLLFMGFVFYYFFFGYSL